TAGGRASATGSAGASGWRWRAIDGPRLYVSIFFRKKVLSLRRRLHAALLLVYRGGRGGGLGMVEDGPNQGPASLTLTPAIAWLLGEAAGAAGPSALLGGLAERLAAEGLPLARATLSVASLDPLLAGSEFEWRRADGRVLEAPRFHGVMAKAATGPAADLALGIPGTAHPIAF